jgi:Ca-activated chloride channel family protein
MLTFAYPEIFWFLLLIPLIIGLYGLAKYIRSRSLKRFGNPDVFASLMPSVSKYMPPIKLTLQLLIVLFLIIVMARPWGGVKDQKSEKHGIEVVIAMDVSNSMLASSTGEDGGTSRLRTAKLMLEKLINKLDNDRVGLIVYAGEAYTLLPVTSDYVSAKMFLNSINTDMVPVQGTDIAGAISAALNSFSDRKDVGKSSILITDVEDLEGEALTAAQSAKEMGVQVNVIGVGSSKGAIIPIGNGQYFRDDNGQVVTTLLNEQLGVDIAKEGGGIYVNANNSDALTELYKQLSKIKKSSLQASVYTVHDELFTIFAWIVLALLVIDVFVLERKIGWLTKFTFFKKEDKK